MYFLVRSEGQEVLSSRAAVCSCRMNDITLWGMILFVSFLSLLESKPSLERKGNPHTALHEALCTEAFRS